MKTIQKSIRITASRATIYDYVTEPSNLPEIWPSLIEVSNVARKPDGTHSFDFLYKMAGVRFHGHAATTQVMKDRLSVVETKVGIISTFRWNFEGRDETTEVKLHVEYEVPIPLLGRVAESFLVRLNERECEHLLASLKDRIESSLVREVKPEVRPELRPH